MQKKNSERKQKFERDKRRDRKKKVKGGEAF